MAISPCEVPSLRYDFIKQVEKRIDEHLQSNASEFVILMGANVRWIDVLIPGEFNPIEKQHLSALYEIAGWQKVFILNSSENGERGGLAIVRLANALDTTKPATFTPPGQQHYDVRDNHCGRPW